MIDPTAATTYEDATPQQRGLLLELLRRVLKLSDSATIEDINRALIAIDEGEGTIKALSASRLPNSAVEEQVRCGLGIHPEAWRRFGGESPLQALSASLPETEETIRRQLGISEETWLRFNRN
jgi:hypothetical protein